MGLQSVVLEGSFISLSKTLMCGQAFRWEVAHTSGDTALLGFPRYNFVAHGVVQDSIVKLFWNDSELLVVYQENSQMTKEFWQDYFGLRAKEWEWLYVILDESGDFEGKEFCMKALMAFPGLNILKQDPWECLISFIISQRNRIPRIRQTISTLSQACGESQRLATIQDFIFPTSEQIASKSLEDLESLKLGYRSDYVLKAAKFVCKYPGILEYWGTLTTYALKQELMTLHGVGPKVASCVALYGFGRHDEFPVDVWIDRVINEHFGGTNPAPIFGPYAGIMQLCLFSYVT